MAHPSSHRGCCRARGDAELISLLSLGGGIGGRLQADAAATWSQRLATGHSGVGSSPAGACRAVWAGFAALRAWLAEPALDAELVMIDAAHARSLSRVDGRVRVELPFAWLAEVWAKGMATVAGRFCLAADTSDGRHWRLTTAGPDFGQLEVVTVTHGDG